MQTKVNLCAQCAHVSQSTPPITDRAMRHLCAKDYRSW